MWVAFALHFCSKNINVFENTEATIVNELAIYKLVKHDAGKNNWALDNFEGKYVFFDGQNSMIPNFCLPTTRYNTIGAVK